MKKADKDSFESRIQTLLPTSSHSAEVTRSRSGRHCLQVNPTDSSVFFASCDMDGNPHITSINNWDSGTIFTNDNRDSFLLVNSSETSIAVASAFLLEKPQIRVFDEIESGSSTILEGLLNPAFLFVSESKQRFLVGRLEDDEYYEIDNKDLLGFKIKIDDTTVVSKSGRGIAAGAVFGGLIGGKDGALLGSLLADEYIDKEINNVTIKLIINNPQMPLISLDIYDKGALVSPEYFSQIDEISASLTRIVELNKAKIR